MNNIVFLNLINNNSYSSKRLPGGLSTAEMLENYCAVLPDINKIIPIAVDPEQLKVFYGDAIPEDALVLKDNRQDLLLKAMAELSPDFDHCFYFYGDTPLLDIELSENIYARHCRYYADYSFADGYPLGLSPEIIRPSALAELLKIVGEKADPVERDSLFSWIQKDINSFDIETEISPVDLRLKRISLSTDNRLNFLQLKSFMEDEFSRAADFTSRSQDLEKHCRSLPAYYQIQITASCPQSCSYCPYPGINPDHMNDSSHMAKDQILELCHSIEAFSPDAQVSLSLWGEPSSHPQIMEVLEELRSIPLRYVIETCGIGWPDPETDDNNGIFSDNRFEWIISLDALDPSLYRKLRGEGMEEANTFSEKMLRLNPSHTWIQAVRMKENEEDLESFYRYWKDKTDNVIIQKHDFFCTVLPDRKVTDLSPLNRFPCWHLKREICLNIDGDSLLCREDLKGEHTLGNCFKDGLEEIWNRGRPCFEDQIAGKYKHICAECDEYYSFNF